VRTVRAFLCAQPGCALTSAVLLVACAAIAGGKDLTCTAICAQVARFYIWTMNPVPATHTECICDTKLSTFKMDAQTTAVTCLGATTAGCKASGEPITRIFRTLWLFFGEQPAYKSFARHDQILPSWRSESKTPKHF
jgi:hypothetical protein